MSKTLLLLPLLIFSCASSSSEHQGVEKINLQQVIDMQGKAHSLQASTNVLVFWQPWCASCAQESFEIVKKENSRSDLSFFGVISGPDSAVDDAEVAATARKWKYSFPQIRDRSLELTKSLQVTGTPTIVVLSATGEILYKDKHLPNLAEY